MPTFRRMNDAAYCPTPERRALSAGRGQEWVEGKETMNKVRIPKRAAPARPGARTSSFPQTQAGIAGQKQKTPNKNGSFPTRVLQDTEEYPSGPFQNMALGQAEESTGSWQTLPRPSDTTQAPAHSEGPGEKFLGATGLWPCPGGCSGGRSVGLSGSGRCWLLGATAAAVPRAPSAPLGPVTKPTCSALSPPSQPRSRRRKGEKHSSKTLT